MDQPLVSVVMPLFNTALYVSESIHSILNQTYQNIELIIVNDGSTDNSEEVALSFSDSRIKYYRNEENRKIVYTRNRAIELAKGEYIAFLDSDDISSPERIQLQVDFLRNNTKYGFVGSHVKNITSDGVVGPTIDFPSDNDLIRCILLFKNTFCASAVMFRREIVNHIGGYRSFLPEDWDLWVRLREIGPIHNLRERVLNYRVHPGQLSREKMYAQAIGKQFVSTSYFARQESIRDYPESHEDPSLWLEKTKSELRKTSRDFRKFELHSEKVEMINSILQLRLKKDLIKEILSVFQDSPVFTVKYLAMRVIRKLKLKSYKSV
jgi:glycosyltransferase involved in cell wall biosynthesis